MHSASVVAIATFGLVDSRPFMDPVFINEISTHARPPNPLAPRSEDAPAFVEVGEAGIAVDHVMRRQFAVQRSW